MEAHFNIVARKVEQGNQEFFIGIFSIKEILSFTKYTERLIVGFDDNNQPIYNDEIQRKVEQSRVEKIADFLIDDPDALFPTNLVLSLPNAAISSLEMISNNTVGINLIPEVFSEVKKANGHIYLTIIDGQHRIRGIEKAIERLKTDININMQVGLTSKDPAFQKKIEHQSKLLSNLMNIDLTVSFFIDPTLEFQAMIFSTINRTQKSVPQSLVYSLFGLTEKDSPQKTALQIALALNSFEKSPFYNRVKLHGGSYDRNQSPPLTQAMFVKTIIDLISVNARDSEKDRFKERKDLLVNISAEYPFRKYYAKNEDNTILDILFSYFTAVKNVFQYNGVSLWDFMENTKPSNILQTTVGFQALIRILIDILRIEKMDTQRDKIETYELYLRKAKLLDVRNNERYPFTSKSRLIFYLDLSIAIWPIDDDNDDRMTRLTQALKL